MPPKQSSFRKLRSTRSARGVQGVADDLDEIGDVIGEVIGEEFGDDVIGEHDSGVYELGAAPESPSPEEQLKKKNDRQASLLALGALAVVGFYIYR